MKPRLDEHYKLFIDGKWVDSSCGKTFTATNPANGETLATCSNGCAEDVDFAVDAAWAAFPAWKKTSPTERAAMLNKVADLIDANAEHLAMVETCDNGKPIRETMNIDVPLSSDHFRYFASVVRTEEGRAVMIDDQTMSIILREPIGVVGQIIPWNFPLLMAAWKISPALAAGDCVVIKPSIETSLSMLELTKLMAQVLPAGVINVITGKGSLSGDAMLKHDGFSKLAFTGSTEAGFTVAEAASKRLVPSTLELGGKSANIFFPDAPWEKALEGLQLGMGGGRFTAGGVHGLESNSDRRDRTEEATRALRSGRRTVDTAPTVGLALAMRACDHTAARDQVGNQAAHGSLERSSPKLGAFWGQI